MPRSASGPHLLILARLLQGFAVGGEVGPATMYVLEAAPPGRRILFASWQLASQNPGKRCGRRHPDSADLPCGHSFDRACPDLIVGRRHLRRRRDLCRRLARWRHGESARLDLLRDGGKRSYAGCYSDGLQTGYRPEAVAAGDVARGVIASGRDAAHRPLAPAPGRRRSSPDFRHEKGLTMTESAHMFRALSAGRRVSLYWTTRSIPNGSKH